jgi:hypothetical protein
MPSRRSKSARLIGLAGLVAAFPGVVSAAAPREAELGTRIPTPKPVTIPDRLGLSDQDRARVALIAFGECVVARSPKLAKQLVATPADDPAADKLLSRMATPDCLRDGEMRMSSLLMRGAVFVGLYRSTFGRSQPAISPEPTNFNEEVGNVSDAAARQHIVLREFGDCVVRAVPDQSRALLLATPTGQAEQAAFGALTPKLGPCLVEGSNVTISKITLTGVIGEALYRLASRSSAASARSAG